MNKKSKNNTNNVASIPLITFQNLLVDSFKYLNFVHLRK